jgi:magnesium-transporting ATPase (P-type)
MTWRATWRGSTRCLSAHCQGAPAGDLQSSEQLLRVKRNLPAKVHAAILALALCHNVTPVEEGFQASSPDEVALVKFARSVGLSLVARDLRTITLRNPLQVSTN